MSLREKFVARFGEDNAAAVEAAGRGHAEELIRPDGIDQGSDPFRTWVVFCIGFECLTKYRVDHGITADSEDLRRFVREEADLRHHDGDFDALGLLVGAYEDWMESGPVADPDADRAAELAEDAARDEAAERSDR
jgi:hypothetical protein